MIRLLSAVVACTALARCMEEHVVMEKSSMEDQASSATGYAYSSDSGGPMSYMHFSNGAGDMEHIEIPYAQEILPPYEYHYIPVTDHSMHYIPQLHKESPSSYGVPSAYSEVDYNRIKYGFDKHGLFDDYEGSSGDKYKHEDHSSFGEKGDKGYKHVHDWDKEKKAEHEKEKHKGWYGAEGANKHGHHEHDEKWSSKDAEGYSNKGESFKEGKGHKKGVKTTGYHKVYRKDEFKKDHDFYDKADHKGHFDKYGSFDAKHEDKEGAYQKGSHEESGYHKDEQGKKGYYDKGAHEEKDKEHKKELSEEEFHKNYDDFVKKAGERDKKHYEYSDGSGGKKWSYY